MNWEQTAAGYHCTRHGQSFQRAEVCSACVTDPGEDTVEAQTSDAIDGEIIQRAGEYTSRARRLWRECADMLEGTPGDKIQSAKLSAEAVKWERLSLEAKDKVSSRKHLREAMAHEQAMSAHRGPN